MHISLITRKLDKQSYIVIVFGLLRKHEGELDCDSVKSQNKVDQRRHPENHCSGFYFLFFLLLFFSFFLIVSLDLAPAGDKRWWRIMRGGRLTSNHLLMGTVLRWIWLSNMLSMRTSHGVECVAGNDLEGRR